jgi:hypothetical protein
VNVSRPSFLKVLANRVLNRVVPANGGYVFNLRGRWRYEARSQRCQVTRPSREWSGEVLAYAWLARQAKERAKTTDKPDAQILALTRS